MANSVEEMVDMLIEIVEGAKNVPLSSEKCMIERDNVVETLKELRDALPIEMRRAKELVEKKADYVASAKREADDLRQRAEDHVRRILHEDALVVEARRVSEELLLEAEQTSRQLKQAANEYCEETLHRMEEVVLDAYDEIKHSRARFRSTIGTGVSAARIAYDDGQQ